MDKSIRNDLAQTTFEDLLKMKDKLGTKVYRDSVLKKISNEKLDTSDESDSEANEVIEEDLEQTSDSDSDNEKSVTNNFAYKGSTKIKPKKFERVNRGFPIEASSKKIDNRFNFAVKPIPSDEQVMKKKIELRDPRFDPKCGQFDSKYFEKNYSFLKQMKQDELQLLKKQLKKAKNDETKEQLQFLIKRLINQIKSEEEKAKTTEMKKLVQQKVSTIKQIEPKKNKPIYVNKGTLKRAQLIEKFKHLKQTGKLDKYIEKKRKKNVAKDRRLINKKI